MLESGGTPQLAELRLHNGTIYRWNRPVYDVVDGLPHLRVENRVLPAGPTVVDTMANAAFYFGLVRTLAEQRAPAVVADVVHRGGGELPRAPAAGHRRRRCTGRVSGRCRPPSWCCGGCCRWPARGSPTGALRTLSATGCSASSSNAAWPVRTAPPGRSTGSGPGRPPATTGTRHCARRCSSTASGCTPTRPCTPGRGERAWTSRAVLRHRLGHRLHPPGSVVGGRRPAPRLVPRSSAGGHGGLRGLTAVHDPRSDVAAVVDRPRRDRRLDKSSSRSWA